MLEYLHNANHAINKNISFLDVLAEERAIMHCLHFRITELYTGFLHTLEAKYWLTALSAARNCVETIAYAIYYIDEFKIALTLPENETMTAINDLRIKYTLAQRNKDKHKIAKDGLPKHGINPEKTITTKISDQLKKCTELGYPIIEELYNYLTEYAHPSATSTYIFYTIIDPNNSITLDQNLYPTFGESKEIRILKDKMKAAIHTFSGSYQQFIDTYLLSAQRIILLTQ